MTTNPTNRIALIEAAWHKEIVEQCYVGLTDILSQNDIDPSLVDRFEVPGSLEIPLTAKKLAMTKKYTLIIATGLIVDGGIYRHDFVANAVLQGIMQVQLECVTPILSVILTPHHFHQHETHQEFFRQHFVIKGREVGQACISLFELNL